MQGVISVAGFMMTSEEWEELDAVSRAQLVAVITRRDDPWIASGAPEPLAPSERDPSQPGG